MVGQGRPGADQARTAGGVGLDPLPGRHSDGDIRADGLAHGLQHVLDGHGIEGFRPAVVARVQMDVGRSRVDGPARLGRQLPGAHGHPGTLLGAARSVQTGLEHAWHSPTTE
ncbi:hypothetical protein GCM10018782_45850 [Streptomyces griseoaurantiacus]|nr:hypothetical protein GCM10018782_45850 [Streptomyces griseoaurantiacus]